MRFVYYIHLRICVFHGTCVQLKITYHVEERFQEKYIASTLKEIICHCTFFFDGAVRDWFTNKREWGFDGQMGDRIHPTAHQIDFNRVFVARKSHLHMFICRQTLTDWWKKDKFQVSTDDIAVAAEESEHLSVHFLFRASLGKSANLADFCCFLS